MHKKISFLVAALAVACALIPCPPAIASSEAAPEIKWLENGVLINDTPGKSAQQSPKIVSVGSGSYVIVWMDERNGYNDIFAQKIDERGRKQWGESGIPVCMEPKNQSSPQIIADGKGGAIIVWEDYRSGAADVYAQKLNPDGTRAWDPAGVPVCHAKTAQLAPKLVLDGDGGAIVAWYDYRSGKGEDIYAQRINKNGSTVWGVDGLPISTANGTQWYPEMISDGIGGAIMVWTDFRSGKGSDIYGQHVDSDGNTIWQLDGLPICFAEDNQAYPKLTKDGDDGAIVAWDDFRNEGFDVYAQRITAAGKPSWALNGVRVTPSELSEERPEIVWTFDKGAIISWLSRRGDRTEIFAQKLDQDGALKWEKNGIAISKAQGDKDRTKIIMCEDGGAVIAWEDSRRGHKNIYAQKISEAGFALWELDGAAVCSLNEQSELPDLADEADGAAMIVWQDQRDGNWDIFGQKISGSGSVDWKDNGLVINASSGSVTQQNPHVCYDKDNGAHLVLWEDGRNGYTDIFAQKINAAGTLLFAKEGVPVCDAPGIQRFPETVYAGNGSFIVAWEDNRSNKVWDIYVQKIGPDGKQTWLSEKGSPSWGRIASRSSGTKSRVRLVHDGLGGAILVWQEERPKSRTDIWIQRIDSSGKVLWGPDGVAVSAAQSDQINAVIASDAFGGAIIAWIDYRSGSFNSDIYAQKINSSGNTVWKDNGVPICTAPDSQRSPDIATNGNGGAIITWSDKGGGGYDIYAQVIDDGGRPILTVDGIPICQALGTQRAPKIHYDGAGGAIIVWNDFRQSNWDIYAQRMSSAGSLLWGEEGKAVCAAPLTQYSPELVSGDWGAIVTWEDYRNGKTYNIYAQKLDLDGTTVWSQNGIAVCLSPDGERSPRIAPNGGGGAVIAWEDFRAGGFGIYAQKIKAVKLD